MNRKFKYLFICLPFLFGSVLFSFGIYNLISSLLFFVGGYVVLKNIFDYRKLLRNRDENNSNSVVTKNGYQKDYSYRDAERIVGLKRTRRYSRVRRRVR